MFIFSLLLIISFLAITIALMIFSIGGTIAVIFGADIIIAVFIIWFLFFRSKKNR